MYLRETQDQSLEEKAWANIQLAVSPSYFSSVGAENACRGRAWASTASTLVFLFSWRAIQIPPGDGLDASALFSIEYNACAIQLRSLFLDKP